ncbi:prolyl oligopeptidase family serine peptidase [Bernardetia sp. Wsw4-3y2]|uniref:alpha/beta hydrolase family protein n=1 Tax=unclassified Bernardetia TaxID=2647129 RepID=UPI0030D3BD59
MKLIKPILKIVLFLIIIVSLVIGTMIWSLSYIDEDILTDTVSETKIKFGDFKEGEILKKQKLDGFKYWFLETSGVFFSKFKPLKNTIHYSIAYKSDGLIVTGSMVTPKKEGVYPCIIFNRGGNKDYGRLNFRMVNIYMTALAEQGYVVIASNYRGNSGSEGKEEFGGADVNDVLNLVPALSEEPMANTSKIGLYGHSRGGMMTYKALQNSEIFKTAVVMAGSANEFTSIKDRPALEKNVHAELIPNYYENKEEELKARSVCFWAEELSKTPLLLLHGIDDKRVNYDEVVELTTKLDSLNFPYQLLSFTKGDHTLSKNKKQANARIINWFNKYLREEQSYNETQNKVTIPLL